MTDNNHPITPPPELVLQWWDGTHGAFYEFEAVVTQAARWGADQQLDLDAEQINQAWQKGADHELEACCQQLAYWGVHGIDELRAVRRPRPPSLKEQALEALDSFEGFTGSLEEVDIIRCALEQLDD